MAAPVFRRSLVRAGPLAAYLDGEGILSSVTIAGTPVVHSVAGIVRDDKWGTVPAKTRFAHFERGESSFRSEFSAVTQREEFAFAWEGSVEGTPNGKIRFEFAGEAKGDLLSNRIGLVVLHPIALVGVTCFVDHVDGSQSTGHFPNVVAPHQPFEGIRALRYPAGAGWQVHISFSGDEFETEDQRNWSDASFKTYSRPLALPYPFALPDGTSVRQMVTIEACPDPVAARQLPRSRQVREIQEPRPLTVPSPTGYMPPVGLSWNSTASPEASIEAVALLAPSFLRVDVVVDDSTTFADLAEADLREAASLEVPLELALHVSTNSANFVRDLVAFIDAADIELAATLIFSVGSHTTSRAAFDAVSRRLRQARPSLLLGVGTDDYLAELNRNPVNPAEWGADFVTFSMNPQIHDRRDAAIISTALAIPAMIETATLVSGGSPVGVSPLTLAPRRNIYTPNVVPDLRVPDAGAADSRYRENLGAGWLLSSVAALLTSGVARITLGELVGPRGFGECGDDGSFVRYPAFGVAEALCGARRFAGFHHPHLDAGLVVSGAGGTKILAVRSQTGSGAIDVVIDHESRTMHVPRYGVAVEVFLAGQPTGGDT